ncbi:MAG TPA: DoxX family protein [Gemmatimonadaceae bacterium]|jgi:putative oxidoreductase|nr:DoxX family protein [Gemmatimonadaceae bacterium]
MHPSILDMTTISAGLLLARLLVGLLMAGHGAQKLLGWFGGPGIAGAGAYFEQLGFRPGRFFATVASATEILSGVLVALGLFGPVGPALMLSVMIVAAVSVHWKNGLWAQGGGIELSLFYGTVAVALALTGFGRYSLDSLLGLQSLYTPALAFVALAVGIFGGVGNLLARRPVATA